MTDKKEKPQDSENVNQRLREHADQQEITLGPMLSAGEFPPPTSLWREGFSRRRFLQLMGASMALASACTKQPQEVIVPYIEQPERIVPGKPLYFATSLLLGGYARGALVQSHMGRPTKVEGNPKHPASLGATDLFMQADLLTLYDPDRSQNILRKGRISTWDSFSSIMIDEALKRKPGGGRGIYLLTGAITSPTLLDQIMRWRQAYPEARWHVYEPSLQTAERAGAHLAFGQDLQPVYHFDRADVILALDADFLGMGPGMIPYARQFIEKRRVRTERKSMSRLYCVESMLSITGVSADHRWALSPTEIRRFTRQLAVALGVNGGGLTEQSGSPIPEWVKLIAADLRAHPGASLVVAGPHLPPEIQALAYAMNSALANLGRTVTLIPPLVGGALDVTTSVRQLIEDMSRGRVELLLIMGTNPAYTLPPETDFGKLLPKVAQSVHLGLYQDETAVLCSWHTPESHALESWGDARAYEGTASIIQPLIAPLYASHSAHEILGLLTADTGTSAYDLVRTFWQQQKPSSAFELAWPSWLNEGVIPDTAPAPVVPTLRGDWKRALAVTSTQEKPPLELNVLLDPTIYDGRYANNAWLQECPKPVTKLVWDNAALMSPATAKELKRSNGELVSLKVGNRTVDAPAWIVLGHADHCISVTLGYGRTFAGSVGNQAGFNAYLLRTLDNPWFVEGLQVSSYKQQYPLACTQAHHTMQERELARSLSLAEFIKQPHALAPEAKEHAGPPPSLYSKDQYPGNAWGMVVDLAACIGCNACVVACVAENNIPVVGKDQVLRSREMYWLRIDYYNHGGAEKPAGIFQPRACVHCEKAPCELVCPVAATLHDGDGLNLMIYNRCIGTRYCSNNCPYKVRHFNFLQYTDKQAESLKLMRNPEVTVRNRGVMEKCTYCVQRIRHAHIEAAKENRPIATSEVETACQAACPTRAIIFGDINNRQAEVTRLKQEPHNYFLLGNLNTQPRTSYLARVRNPNPELERMKS